MLAFLVSPIPIMLGIVLFSALSWERIRSHFWARSGRALAIALLLTSVSALFDATHQKALSGRHRAEEIRVQHGAANKRIETDQ